MFALTPRQVNEVRWNRYRTLAGFDDADTFEQSTTADRDAVFRAGITNILASRGVTIRPINLTRVTAIKRPTIPG